MPSTVKNNFLSQKVTVELDNIKYDIDVYDTPLGVRWLDSLTDNLQQKRVLEKNFCFLGFADSNRDLNFLCHELNKNIQTINNFEFDPPYERIEPFVGDDFQYSSNLPIGNGKPGLKLKHESCNLLHRYFEDLQGTAWNISNYYKQADHSTKYAIRQLNNLCHEIESWVLADRKKFIEPEWIRPSQITTFLNAPRTELHKEDFELFKQNRYDRELGGVYLHWSQVGKTLYEVFRDEGAVKMDEATCSAINHQKYYSGEFDVEWGQTITGEKNEFKKIEIDNFKKWLSENGYDWDDEKLSLGYIKLGQIDLNKTFGDVSFSQIYKTMVKNLNIKSIETTVKCEYPYSLDSKDWIKIQMDNLKAGYDSYNLR